MQLHKYLMIPTTDTWSSLLLCPFKFCVITASRISQFSHFKNIWHPSFLKVSFVTPSTYLDPMQPTGEIDRLCVQVYSVLHSTNMVSIRIRFPLRIYDVYYVHSSKSGHLKMTFHLHHKQYSFLLKYWPLTFYVWDSSMLPFWKYHIHKIFGLIPSDSCMTFDLHLINVLEPSTK